MRRQNPEQIIRNVGRRVAELRREARLTQQQLADRAGFSVKYLQRIEAGQANLSIRSLVEMANVLGHPVSVLFEPATSRTANRGRPRR